MLARWTATDEFQAATQQAGTNPSEVIRGLVREWVENNTQHEGEK